jgi:hypothetical protein
LLADLFEQAIVAVDDDGDPRAASKFT